MKNFNKEFLKFIDESPTAFQATENIKNLLIENGFIQLHEREKWSLEASNKYFVTRNKSSIIAFTLKDKNYETSGFSIVGAHYRQPLSETQTSADKPQTRFTFYRRLNLMVAEPGKPGLTANFPLPDVCSTQIPNNELSDTLIDFKKPVATIPNLAIHLSPKEAAKIDKQKELPPLMLLGEDSFEDLLLKRIEKNRQKF